MIEIVILDVGHGNSAIVTDGQTVLVIDAPPDDTLLRALTDRAISVIDHLLLSHADEDHCGGAAPILANRDLLVRNVYINPHAAQGTRAWERLMATVEDARGRGTEPVPELSDTTGPLVSFEGCRIDVLFPTRLTAMRGVGGTLAGRRLTANSMSAVIKVTTDDDRTVLFAGDTDDVALQSMFTRGAALESDVLVYPHHGGRALSQRTPAALQDFAHRLTDAVRPSTVAFSLGRLRNNNPRSDVVKGVRDARPAVRIMCTQLSRRCAAEPGTAFSHLTSDPSSGKTANLCCAGSMKVEPGGAVLPDVEAHLAFINAHADNAMCLSDDLVNTHGASD